MTDDFAPLGGDPAAAALKQELTNIIMWNDREAPRSKQRAIGPSEVGDPCDRRIAYRIANTPRINFSDPWPAIVGTSIHAWLEAAIERYQQLHGDQGWITELRVAPDDLVRGRSDLYNSKTGTVVDWKTAGSDKVKKLHRGDPPSEGYVSQINLYGLGYERAGYTVNNVALVFLPRSGWLEDAFVWRAPYDRDRALAVLERFYRIGYSLLDLDIENHPENFARVPAKPGDSCVWCPMFNRRMDPTVQASDIGCPGR